MAFELTVTAGQATALNLAELWPESLRRYGIACTVHPSFSPKTWQGGLLPFRVDAMPTSLIGIELQAPATSGFEVYFDGDSVTFRSAMSRTSTEFALLCLCAAELACFVDGLYCDPQSGRDYKGEDARLAALEEIHALLAHGGRGLLMQHPLVAWV